MHPAPQTALTGEQVSGRPHRLYIISHFQMRRGGFKTRDSLELLLFLPKTLHDSNLTSQHTQLGVARVAACGRASTAGGRGGASGQEGGRQPRLHHVITAGWVSPVPNKPSVALLTRGSGDGREPACHTGQPRGTVGGMFQKLPEAGRHGSDHRWAVSRVLGPSSPGSAGNAAWGGPGWASSVPPLPNFTFPSAE